MGFRARLERRTRLWWDSDSTAAIHAKAECHAPLHHEDSDSDWRCCPYWQRKLSNKWNAREFAIRCGVDVPRLYWAGRNLSSIPFGSLPDAFVIRATFGSGAQNVLTLDRGLDLLSGRRYTRAGIVDRIRRMLNGQQLGTWVLIEELLRPEGPSLSLPTTYRFHTFGSEVVNAFALRRPGVGTTSRSYHAPNWDPPPFPFHLATKASDGRPAPRPERLDDMLRIATTLGVAYGTYVRVDLYSNQDGCFFGEFSPDPAQGHGFTPPADACLDDAWERHFGDRP